MAKGLARHRGRERGLAGPKTYRARARAWLQIVAAIALDPLGGACARGPQVTGASRDAADEQAYAARRTEMVRSQIRARGIESDSVLAALSRVPRHLFVPEDQRAGAYEDHPLPIGWEQTISQPYIVALMTDLLRLDGSERVLEIGTGSGYQAAVLGELAREVYTIEIVEPLAEGARARLRELGYGNVHVRAGDGYQGWPEAAPFDAIILTAAPPAIPQPLIDQLALGGILTAPIGDSYQQDLVLMVKTAAGLERREVIPVRFVPMTGEAQEKP